MNIFLISPHILLAFILISWGVREWGKGGIKINRIDSKKNEKSGINSCKSRTRGHMKVRIHHRVTMKNKSSMMTSTEYHIT